jgi:predicted transposase/invertase (TIGR01784 family)
LTVKILPQNPAHDSSHHKTMRYAQAAPTLWWESSRGREIETIVLYKFPNLSREELETMLGLSELRQTRVYQEAREEGRLEAKLEMVPTLVELGLTVEEIAQRLGLDVETIRKAAQSS